MNKNKIEILLAVALVVSVLYGFYITLIVPSVGFIPSRQVTVPLRLLAIFASAATVLYGLVNKRLCFSKIVIASLVCFWLLYLFRIFQERDNIMLRMPPREYFMYAVGLCILPMMGFFMRWKVETLRKVFLYTLPLGVFTCLAYSWVYRSFFLGGGRLKTGQIVGDAYAISPLHVSYLGSFVICVGFYSLISPFVCKKKSTRIVIGIVSIVAGAVPLIIGASRGAILAVLLVGLLLIVSRARRLKDVLPVLSVGAFFVLALIAVYIFAAKVESNIFDRLMGTQQAMEEGGTSAARLGIYKEALVQIGESPLLGSGLDLEAFRSYPHNIFLEAFLSTGILGGICFCVYIFFCVKGAWSILRSQAPHGWVAVVFFHYFIAAQFSFSLIANGIFWAFSAATIATSPQSIKVIRRVNKNK